MSLNSVSMSGDSRFALNICTGKFALARTLRTSSWTRAALIVIVVQLTAVVTVFTVGIDFETFPGNRIFDVLDLVAFLPGKLVLLALLGQYPHGGSIIYYAEAIAITWLIYTALLGVFLARGNRKRVATADTNEADTSNCPSFLSPIRQVRSNLECTPVDARFFVDTKILGAAFKAARPMMLIGTIGFVATWMLAAGRPSGIADWAFCAFGLVLLNSAAMFGAYLRVRRNQ